MAASITVGTGTMAADGKTITATLSGGTGTGYGPASGVTGISVASNLFYFESASITISGSTLTIHLAVYMPPSNVVVATLETTAGNLTDSGGNSVVLATGITVTNNSAVTLGQYNWDNTALAYWGRFSVNSVQTNAVYYLATDSIVAFSAPGTDLQFLGNNFGDPGLQVSINNASYVNVDEFSRYTWANLFTAQLEATYTVQLRSAGGAGFFFSPSFMLKGAAPALTPYDARHYYVVGDTHTFQVYGLVEGGFTAVDVSGYSSPGLYTSAFNDCRIRFEVTAGSNATIFVWVSLYGETVTWYKNGVKQGSVTVDDDGILGWFTLATGQTFADGDIIAIATSISFNNSVNQLDAIGLLGCDLKQNQPAKQSILCCIGDSITAGVNSAERNSSTALTAIVGYAIGMEPNNRGISGNTTSQVAARVSADVPSATTVCVLHVGTNDVTAGTLVATFKTSYTLAINNILGQCSGLTKLICFLILPRTFAPTDVSSYNTAILQAVASIADPRVITCFAPSGFNPAAGADTLDGLHPNDSGYQKMMNVVVPLIAGYTPSFGLVFNSFINPVSDPAHPEPGVF